MSIPEITDMDRRAAELEMMFEQHRASATVEDIREGPCLTLFDVAPKEGVKVNRVRGLADEVAMQLRAQDCRAVSRPEDGVVTFEVTRRPDQRQGVLMSDVLQATVAEAMNMRLPFVMGKGVCGRPVVGDLSEAPHLLVAGSTGSGKSVFLRTLIRSLTHNLDATELRMVLIDPKRLEMAEFASLPHLLTSPVTDTNESVMAMRMLVKEMQNRYKAMEKTGARTLEEHNAILHRKGQGSAQLPRIVCVVDEYADLMTMAGKQVEDAVRRITAVARAAGVHLVLATQRPSVDVVTGVVKANLPTRLCFRVTSGTDSRVILDRRGAENLLGAGDALWFKAGDVERLHCAWPDMEGR